MTKHAVIYKAACFVVFSHLPDFKATASLPFLSMNCPSNPPLRYQSANALLFSGLLLLLLSGCGYFSGRNAGNEPVARAQNAYLYRSQLEGLVSLGSSPQDSIQIVNGYIENWVRRQTILQQADKELVNNMPDLEQQLQDYKESLLLHTFEQQLLQQYADTLINPVEIETYYQQNKSNFVLNNNMLKVAFVLLNKDAAQKDSVKLLLKKGDEAAFQTLDQLCKRHNFSAVLPPQWWTWDNLRKQIPLEESDFTAIAQNKFYQSTDAVNAYYLVADEVSRTGEPAPLEYCTPEIKKIIAHKRSLQYLQEAKNRYYQDALNKGNIEIYRKQ